MSAAIAAAVTGAQVRNRLLSMSDVREQLAAGGLLSYGPPLTGMFALAANYVDRIAKGAKPRRPADRAADQIRACHQPQDRNGNRHHHSPHHARPRR